MGGRAVILILAFGGLLSYLEGVFLLSFCWDDLRLINAERCEAEFCPSDCALYSRYSFVTDSAFLRVSVLLFALFFWALLSSP